MVTLKPAGEYNTHYLKSKVHFDGFKEGSVKSCAVQYMDNKRFGIMATYFNDYFYKVFETEEDLHESFDELTLEQYNLEIN